MAGSPTTIRSAFARVTATVPGVSVFRRVQTTYYTIEATRVRDKAEGVAEVRLDVVSAAPYGRNYHDLAFLRAGVSTFSEWDLRLFSPGPDTPRRSPP